jgi:hypothetical protein
VSSSALMAVLLPEPERPVIITMLRCFMALDRMCPTRRGPFPPTPLLVGVPVEKRAGTGKAASPSLKAHYRKGASASRDNRISPASVIIGGSGVSEGAGSCFSKSIALPPLFDYKWTFNNQSSASCKNKNLYGTIGMGQLLRLGLGPLAGFNGSTMSTKQGPLERMKSIWILRPSSPINIPAV